MLIQNAQIVSIIIDNLKAFENGLICPDELEAVVELIEPLLVNDYPDFEKQYQETDCFEAVIFDFTLGEIADYFLEMGGFDQLQELINSPNLDKSLRSEMTELVDNFGNIVLRARLNASNENGGFQI